MEQSAPSLQYGFLGYCLEPASRRLTDPEGMAVTLNDRAFDTLCCLVSHAGQTLGKDFLLSAVWSSEVVEENNLNQAILSLRKSLGDDSRNPRFIRTVTRRGFCFVAPVDVQSCTMSRPQVQPELVSSRPAALRKLLPYAAALLLSVSMILAWPQWSLENSAPPPAATVTAVSTVPDLLDNSVAILPFRSITNDATEDLFSTGLHAEIISRLSTVEGLQVIGRESILAPALDTSDIESIRQALHVEAVMSGTVLFQGERARINLELIDSRTLLTLWSDSFEIQTHSLDNIFSVQSDMAISIAEALTTTLDNGTLEELRLKPTHSLEAYGYQLASRQAFEDQDYERAWTLGKLAVELDPGYLDAIYNFSHINAVLISMPLPRMDSDKHLELALQLADQYIELAPDQPLGYSLRGAALNIVGDWRGVLDVFERINTLGFSLADMRFNSFMLGLGKFDEAIAAFERRLQTDPLNTFTRGFLMVAYEAAGNRRRAREIYETGEALHGEWWGDEVEVILQLGRHEPVGDVDSLRVSDDLKLLLRNLDDRNFVRDALQDLTRREYSDGAELIHLAAIASHVGEPALALQLLENAVNTSWLTMLWTWLPIFDDLRGTERFHAMIDEFGVTEYWNRLGWSEVCEPDGALVSCSWQAYTAL